MTKRTEAVESAIAAPAPSIFTDTTKVALYGRFGSGKTLQIGSLIKLVGADNVIIISAEHGLNTIRSRVREDMVIPVASLAEVRQAWAKVRDFAQPDRWVVLDGMSQVMEWIANEHLTGADRVYEARQLGREPATADLPYGRYIVRGEINTMGLYGKVGRDSENLLSAWIGLPVNLYANYLEDMTGTSGWEKSIPWGPDVPGRVGLKAVMSSFDFVGRLFYDEKGEITAGFDSTSKLYMARTREDRTLVTVPKEIHQFDLGAFVQLVRGEKAAEVAAA